MRKILLLLICTLYFTGCTAELTRYAAFEPDASARLVVYTSHKPEVYEPIVKEFEERTGIWVSVEAGGTSEMLERIAAEAGGRACDVMFGGGVESLEAYKAYFTPYKSPQTQYVLPAYLCTDSSWTPFSALPLVIIYNPKLVPAGSLSGWRDLLDPQWKGKIAFADPNISGSCYTTLATMLQVMDGSADDILARFAENLDGRQLDSSGDIVSAVADGAMPIGITLEETAQKRILEGSDVAMLHPAEGTSAVPDGAALVKGAQNEENAKRFLDFILSEHVQALLTGSFSRRAVRENIEASESLAPMAELNVIDYQLGWASASRERLLAKWEALYEAASAQ